MANLEVGSKEASGGEESHRAPLGQKRWSSRVRQLIGPLLFLSFGVLVHSLSGYTLGAPGHAHGSDDAFISFRYARNFAHGLGLVFNPGEYVEGYSNLLHVLLVSPSAYLGDGFMYPVALAINLFFAAAALCVFFRFAADELGPRRARVAAYAFALSPLIWLWVASAMETPLILFGQIWAWVSVERIVRHKPGALGPLCAAVMLLVYSRADGFVTPVFLTTYLALRARFREAAILLGVLGASMAALVSFRMAYYGYPLPNTYYAKVAGPIWQRLLVALTQFRWLVPSTGLWTHLMVLAVALGLALYQAIRKRTLGVLHFGVLLGPPLLAYWFYVGGDHFGERFLLVLVPLGIFAALKLGEWHVRWSRAAVALLLLGQLSALRLDNRFQYRHLDRYDMWVELGKTLALEPPGRLLAIDAAGKVPFFSHLPTVDMLGLNDEFLAHRDVTEFREPGHNKYDPNYVLGRKPALLATWIKPNLDLFWGLDRARYRSAGFELKYLVSFERAPTGPPVMDVASLEPPQVIALIEQGYIYAVAERTTQRKDQAASQDTITTDH